MYVSNCCGAYMNDVSVDMGICPDCKEHCAVDEESEED